MRINDTVVLKSGGPDMKVTDRSETECECKWASANEIQTANFPFKCLDVISHYEWSLSEGGAIVKEIERLKLLKTIINKHEERYCYDGEKSKMMFSSYSKEPIAFELDFFENEEHLLKIRSLIVEQIELNIAKEKRKLKDFTDYITQQ
jgi:uncharacterized protein YodC (DUF2158 family)/uncharacterized protein YkuJ